MNGLPARTNGGVRVRSLDHVGEGAAAAPRSAGSLALQQAASVGRVPPLRLLRFPVVRERTGLSRSTIWRLERRGEFPRHHRIAPNVVAWSEEEISNWIVDRMRSVAV
ncbi:MAG: AlpA family phage regulatory protein [Gemmatimonadaceae bacterium]